MDLAQAVVNNDWFVLSLVILVHDSLKCLIMWVIPFLLSSLASFLQYIHSAQQHQIVFEFHLSFFFFYIQLVKMIDLCKTRKEEERRGREGERGRI